jgi:hypothetical protein
MAFTAKDGSKHTNIDSMKRADAHQMAAAPAAGAEPDGDEGAEGGTHDPQSLEMLKQDFDSVMQALGSGQQPDPEAIKRLILEFGKFITEEEHEGEGGEGY